MRRITLLPQNENVCKIDILDETITGDIHEHKFCIDADSGRLYDIVHLITNYKFPYNKIGKQFELVIGLIEDYVGISFYEYEYLDF